MAGWVLLNQCNLTERCSQRMTVMSQFRLLLVTTSITLLFFMSIEEEEEEWYALLAAKAG